MEARRGRYLMNFGEISMRCGRHLKKDCRKLAEFAEEILRQSYQVVAVRTEQYYRRMLAEQKSEHGGIGMIEKNWKLVGSFFLQKRRPMKIREPLLKKGEEEALPQAVFWLTKGNEAIFL